MSLRRIGRYAVFGELAAGGMATVYIGRLLGPVGFARRVAIKSLHSQFAKDADFLSMFLDEARLSGSVQHPNVVQILDVISTSAELHLVMEYIEGEPLSRLMRVLSAAGERVPVPVAVAIITGVLEGLHAAHEARSENGQPLHIVHRDVSPHNVLVGVDGVPRILDFGVAKAVGRMQTTRGDQLKGKLAYMAPEQLSREPLDRRADVYAAGIVLWELLTGERLFQAEDEISTFKRALERVAPAPSSLHPALPGSLDGVVCRALARKPDERFGSARDFALVLEATGLLASTRQLGAWVESVAARGLAERAARIAEYEAAFGSSPVASATVTPDDEHGPVPTALAQRGRTDEAEWATAILAAPQTSGARTSAPRTSTPGPSTPRTRTWRWLAALLALGLAASWFLFSSVRPGEQNARAELGPRPQSDGAPGAPSLVVSKGGAPQAASAGLGAISAVLSAEPARSVGAPVSSPPINPPTARKKSLGTPAKKPKPSGCETPFTVDARGVRVPKLECL